MATLLSQTLASATQSNSFNPQVYSNAGRRRAGPKIKITGGVGTLQVELTDDGGTNWFRFGDPVTLAAGNKVLLRPHVPQGFTACRINVTAYTSGNIVILATD